MLLNWSGIMLPLPLLGKKLRLNRLGGADTDEEAELLLVFPWRSGSCMRPLNCLLENGPCWGWRSWNPWLGSFMKKAGEADIDWGDCTPNDDWFKGEIKCSNFGAPLPLPRLKILLMLLVADWLWFWSWGIWVVPTWDRPKLMWFVP